MPILSHFPTSPAIPPNFADTSDATAVSDDILSRKTAYVNGDMLTGTMTNNGAVGKTLTVSDTSYTVPAGYHSGSGKVQISIEEKAATPTKSTQSIVPTSGKVLSKVTVNPIPPEYISTTDATAAAVDILSGKTAYVDGEKISGSMPDNGEIDVSVSTGFSTVPPKITIPNGYTAGGSVDLTPVLDGLNTVIEAGYSNGGFAEFHSNSISIKNTLIDNINKLGLHISSGGTLTLPKNSSFASCALALSNAEAPKSGGFYTSIPITISTTTQTVSTGLSSVSNIAVYYSGTYPAPGGTYSAKGMAYAEGTKIVYASSSDVVKVESISGGDITFKFTLPAYSSGAVVDYHAIIFAH